MKKNKILALAISASVIVGSSIPAIATEKITDESIQTEVTNITTNDSVGLEEEKEKDLIPNEALADKLLDVEEIAEDEITLVAKIKEDDGFLTVKVTGVNKAGEPVKLDKDLLEYNWISKANKNDDGEVIGDEEKLKITDDLQGKFVYCEVSYDEQEGLK